MPDATPDAILDLPEVLGIKVATLDSVMTFQRIARLMDRHPDKLLITADAVQNAHVSFAHPDWQPRADMDGAKAAGSRRHLLDMAATDKLQVLSYHIPFPGLGRVERTGSAFTWVAGV